MKTKIVYFSFIGLLIFILEFGLVIKTVSADGNDLWVGALRVDQDAVANAWDYQVYLMASTLPTNPDGNTSNWLAIIGSTEDTAFQVGLFAGSNGLRWFVESFYYPLGVTCLRGNGNWGHARNGNWMGCLGNINDLVTLGNWNRKDFQTDFVGLSVDAAELLVDRNVKLVGIDYLSVAPFKMGKQVHTILLNAGVVVIEGLDLSTVSPGRYTLHCLPLKLGGADGAPTRAILVGV